MHTVVSLTKKCRVHVTRSALSALIGLGSLAAAGSLAGAAEKLDVKLPDAIKKAGEIHVAANAAYPPFNFQAESGNSDGVEVDLLNAIGDRIGVKMKYSPSGFVTVLPGVTAGRFDLGAAGFWNTEERQKVVDFINYAYAVDGLVVMKGNPAGITVDNLCGKTISGSQGSYQANNLKAISDKCVADGKPAIDIALFQGTPNQIVALKSGRVQASNIDRAVGSYLAQKDGGSIEPLPTPMLNAEGKKFLMAFMVKKGEMDLARAIQAGLNAVIKDGRYAQILKKWGLAEAAQLPEATLN